MVSVQKVTSLAFSFADGRFVDIGNCRTSTKRRAPERVGEPNGIAEVRRSSPRLSQEIGAINPDVADTGTITNESFSEVVDKILSEEQRKFATKDVPNPIEYLSYIYHFPSVLCGPLTCFKDYVEFVNSPKVHDNHGLTREIFKKVAISVLCAIIYLVVSPYVDVKFLKSKNFLVDTHILKRFFLIIVITTFVRFKYYIAWYSSDAIINACGFGFNGYDQSGRPKWDLATNVDFGFETSLNVREATQRWNKMTHLWLKRLVHHRIPKKVSILVIYLLSAVWHGFYPGYYMTFLSGALFTYAATNGRRLIRPLFQRGQVLPMLYDFLTFILTRITIAYIAFPFVILDFHNNFEIYKSLYFSLHIVGIVGVLLGYVGRGN